ncbi:hypothetical protein SBRCBS47491_009421 [Sporothrix bragantina]|uniref:Uncharacterized protein n=1 Tax=Sporothrix bragantina TaxID=671064 RepID=A0ABP0CV83_9PEZI
MASFSILTGASPVSPEVNSGLSSSTSISSDSSSFSPASSLGTPYYDCEGSSFCGSLVHVKHCDEAVNNMNRGNRIYVSNSAALAGEGNCWANTDGDFGCKIYIQGRDESGNNCRITGDDMWWAYQDIRKQGNCGKCGSKHLGNGCIVSIDYESNCDNRSPGLDSLPPTVA